MSLARIAVLGLVLCFLLLRLYVTTDTYTGYNPVPYSRGFLWPAVTAHSRLASRFLQEIPATASVTTQTKLGPHLSEREEIYLFPYGVGQAQYIFLDTTGSFFPYKSYSDFASEARAILQGGSYGVIDLEDGYLLLEKGSPPQHVAQALQMIAARSY